MKKILTSCAALALLLTGCQLAREDEPRPDKGALCGVQVFLEDGGDGEAFDEHAAGAEYLLITRRTDAQGEAYVDFSQSAGISGGKNALHVADASEEITLTGTLTLLRGHDETLHIYALYQRENGEIYRVKNPGMGGMLDGAAVKYTETKDDDTKSNAVNVMLSIREIDVLQNATVLQMNAAHEQLTATAYTADELLNTDVPSLRAQSDCAYILIEERYTTGRVAYCAYSESASHTLHVPRGGALTKAVDITIAFQDD